MTTAGEPVNIAAHLPGMAERYPDKPAVVLAGRPRQPRQGNLPPPDFPRTRPGSRPLRPRPRTRGHHPRHAHHSHGPPRRRVLRPDVCPVQSRRRPRPDRPRYGSETGRPLPGTDSRRSLHRHPPGPRTQDHVPQCVPHGEHSDHRRPTLVLGRPPPGRPSHRPLAALRDGPDRTGRAGRHPLHQRQHRPRQGRRLRAPHVRRPGALPEITLRLRPRGNRPADLPALRPLRRRPRHDRRHPGDGLQPTGLSRSAQDHLRDSGSARHAHVRFAGPARTRRTLRTGQRHNSTQSQARHHRGRPGSAANARMLACTLLPPDGEVHTPYGASEALPRHLHRQPRNPQPDARTDRARRRHVRRQTHGRPHREDHRESPTTPIADWSDRTRSRDRTRSARSSYRARSSRVLTSRTPRPTPSPRSKTATRSGTAWATSATSTTPAASGSADARLTASSPSTARFSPCSAKPSSTSTRASADRLWSASARSAGNTRSSAIELESRRSTATIEND